MKIAGEARDVALAEVQTVHSLAKDDAMRARLGGLVAAVDAGDVADGDESELLESVFELGLQTGRIRASPQASASKSSTRGSPRRPSPPARWHCCRVLCATRAIAPRAGSPRRTDSRSGSRATRRGAPWSIRDRTVVCTPGWPCWHRMQAAELRPWPR